MDVYNGSTVDILDNGCGYGSACEEKVRKITEKVHGCGKEKKKRVDVTEENGRDRWKRRIRGGDP